MGFCSHKYIIIYDIYIFLVANGEIDEYGNNIEHEQMCENSTNILSKGNDEVDEEMTENNTENEQMSETSTNIVSKENEENDEEMPELGKCFKLKTKLGNK